MKKIGITGGIGSGKSIVAQVLETMHYPVYYSDDQAKELVDSHPVIREKLIDLLGKDIYLEGGINKKNLAEILFKDDEIRLTVNSIIHPYVRSTFQNWVEQQNSKFVFNEAAILFETGAYQSMDLNILVTAPEELKIKRAVERDKCTEKEVLERISKQWDDQKKIPLADFILVNDEKMPLIAQIEVLLETLDKSQKTN